MEAATLVGRLIIQAGDGAGPSWGASGWVGPNSGYIWKVEPVRFADKLQVEFENKRGVRIDICIFGLTRQN